MTDNNKTLINKATRKYIISFLISIIIISLIIISIININFAKKEDGHFAEKGLLNLENWSMDKDKVIELDGQWEFYSGVLIKPGEDFNQSLKQYVEVPGSWEEYLQGKGLENGSGTYRLIIKVPKEDLYGIKTKTIRLANRIYLNGEEVANAGNPSVDSKTFEAESKYNIGACNSLNKEIEMIVHVTSLDFRSGGIIKPIELGLFKSIILESQRAIGLDALVVSVCLCLGLYFLAMYFQRSKDPYLAYFSGGNFFMAINLSTMNEQVSRLIYDYNYITRTRIQILSMIMVTICFLRFIYYFFTDYNNKKMTNIITGMMSATLIFVFNDPSKQISLSLGITQIIISLTIAVSYIYMFYILIKEIHRKTNFIEYISIIIISMFSYWLLLILKTFFEWDLGNIPVALILMIMFSVASMMSHRLQLDYERANNLSEKLIRDDKLKDEFLIKTSHGLRVPLQIVVKTIKDLLEGKKGTLNIKQQENLILIDQEIEQLIRTAHDLQDASLIKKGKVRLRLTSIDPYKIVEDILEEIEIIIPLSDDITIKNQIPNDFLPIKADLDKFRQIIYELVYNAIKYTESGEIIISAVLLDGQAEIKVRDTGIGIEEKYLEEVFDIFYQNNYEDESRQGLGLGLSIVKHLVENQNGKIEVESIYGKGSSFKFTLPLYIKDKDEIENEADERLSNDLLVLSSRMENKKQSNIVKPTILIIDDDISSQRGLMGIKNDKKYNVIIANSGIEALDFVKTYKIDLIILDFMLADMTGVQLCNNIRQQYSMIELPILLLTTSRKTMDLMSTFNYGANDFQRKPVDYEELESRIQSLLLIKKSGEEGLEKEFKYFYSQISPHFLYNTLNSIIGLSYKDGEKTRRALNNLSIYFRGKLDIHRGKGLITLESELELVTAYLEIEEMRYGERLEIEYDIEEGLDALIPPLTLQTIVENSVHHGIVVKNKGGKIKITTKREANGFLSIVIEDNGIGMTLEKQEELISGRSQGMGFKNVMNRMKILKNARLTLDSKIGEGTKIKIIIPEVENHENHLS